MLATAAVLAAESISRVAPGAGSAASGVPADLDGLLTPSHSERSRSATAVRLKTDPLGGQSAPIAVGTVASQGGVPTVSSSVRRGRRLTAILIADGRSVAVIDDAVVLVGDRLPDGARVVEIRSDRVSVVEKGGQKRELTLTSGRQ